MKGAILALLLVSAAAQAHTHILPGGTLVPRNTDANKTGPCGVARGATLNPLVAGQPLNVQFEEFIDHPGHYRIAFSPAGDQGFDQNVLADNLPDTQGGTMPHEYSHVITVPSTPCTDCTIQVIQYMTESTPPTLYYSCADIVIVAPNGTPAPTPAPTPTPTPAPVSPSPRPTVTTLPVPPKTATGPAAPANGNAEPADCAGH